MITDHATLKYIANFKTSNSWIERWSMQLAEYDFDMMHKLGRAQLDADALTHMPVGHIQMTTLVYIAVLQAEPHEQPVLTLDRMKEWQRRDSGLQALLKYKRNKVIRTTTFSAERNELLTRTIQFELVDDVLYYVGPSRQQRHLRLILFIALHHKCLQALYEHVLSGHLGFKRTYNKVHSHFY